VERPRVRPSKAKPILLMQHKKKMASCRHTCAALLLM
jgi:hypothetical protein